MAKRNNRSDQLWTQWLATRPYGQPMEDDEPYVHLMDKVERALSAQMAYFEYFDIPKAALKELAAVLVSYMEDHVSKAGFWAAFTSYNVEKWGRPLPIYPLGDDYDVAGINPEDIAFLIWHWMTLTHDFKLVLSPISDQLTDLAEELCRLLESAKKTLPVLDTHEFLRVPDQSSLLDVREILLWLSQHNYLFGILGFARPIAGQVKATLAKVPAKTNASGRDLYRYDAEIEALYRLRCALGNQLPCEWAARVLRCSPLMREQVRGIQARLYDSFEYTGKDKGHYLFVHHATGRKVAVTKDAVTMHATPGQGFMFGLVQWQGTWWIQGAVVSDVLLDPATKGQDAGSPPAQLRTASEQAENAELILAYAHAFQTQVGSTVKVFPHPQAAADAFQAVKGAVPTRFAHLLKKEITPPGFERFDPGQPLALGLDTKGGSFFCPHTPEIFAYLHDPHASTRTREEIASLLFFYTHKAVVEYVFQHFPPGMIGWEGIAFDMARDHGFLADYFYADH